MARHAPSEYPGGNEVRAQSRKLLDRILALESNSPEVKGVLAAIAIAALALAISKVL